MVQYCFAPKVRQGKAGETHPERGLQVQVVLTYNQTVVLPDKEFNLKISLVDDFLDALAHPQRELIEKLRVLIKNSQPELSEGIKWNAPSYSIHSNDIITFNFRTFGSIGLIFHTGPKGKDTNTGVRAFSDASEEVVWLADKRFVIKVPDESFLSTHGDFIKNEVVRWTNLATTGFSG